MKTATAALLSAPRIVSPALRKTPSSSTTSTWPLCGTVSMWAQNITHSSLRPGSRASRLPAPACGRPGGVVLADLEPERAQLGGDRVGDLTLLAGRAADLAEPDEGLVQSLHGPTG